VVEHLPNMLEALGLNLKDSVFKSD
jgi:hypothetical protein